MTCTRTRCQITSWSPWGECSRWLRTRWSGTWVCLTWGETYRLRTTGVISHDVIEQISVFEVRPAFQKWCPFIDGCLVFDVVVPESILIVVEVNRQVGHVYFKLVLRCLRKLKVVFNLSDVDFSPEPLLFQLCEIVMYVPSELWFHVEYPIHVPRCRIVHARLFEMLLDSLLQNCIHQSFTRVQRQRLECSII